VHHVSSLAEIQPPALLAGPRMPLIPTFLSLLVQRNQRDMPCTHTRMCMCTCMCSQRGPGTYICTNIASAELFYADSTGTCYSSRIIYSPELGSSNLGYSDCRFSFWLAPSVVERTPSPSPSPSPAPIPVPVAEGNVVVEPLIPPQPVRMYEGEGAEVPEMVPASEQPNSLLGMAGLHKQVR